MSGRELGHFEFVHHGNQVILDLGSALGTTKAEPEEPSDLASHLLSRDSRVYPGAELAASYCLYRDSLGFTP